MTCPRCQTVVLTERERDGVLVDVCGTCRGLWLDRGELEELPPRPDDTLRRGARYHGDDHDDDDRRHPKKRRWIDTLGDIFD